MSAFDIACRAANNHLFKVMADPVVIGGVSGTACVVPESNMALGDAVHLYNGAHLIFKQDDFPSIAVNAEVVQGAIHFIVMELDDVDSSGVRTGRMARK
jgi:hypothetical protein